jgi:ATP-dependent DNA ligase
MMLTPPVKPMLAKLERELPLDGYVYEPKWDGFRCLAFRDRFDVDLRSRHDRPLARYFPELVDALLALPHERFVLDGEIVLRRDGTFDFPALMARLHPAVSRIERLRHETPASFVAFDLLAVEDDDLRDRPFSERRHVLEQVLGAAAPPLYVTPATADVELASTRLERFEGVVAKHETLPYQPGRRVMVKVKRDRTVDCVVAGIRWLGDRPLPSSLLLGLYDEDGALEHVGIASGFAERQRRDLLAELGPLIVPIEGHPWEHGFLLAGGPTGRLKGSAGRWTPEMDLEWTPITPERVAEVAYDQLDGRRLRHPGRFRRWRPDRDPHSCTIDQLEGSETPELP